MKNEEFFEEQSEQSEIKTEIVRKYFWAWAKIMISNAKKQGIKDIKIAFTDLFAGTGRYEDESKSTPILILERAIKETEFRQTLITFFNDSNSKHSQKLQAEINQINGINFLKYKPQVENFKVDDELVEKFESMRTIPTLYFLDPWGYKGLSLRLIKAVINSKGCDCVFFFNYNRINAALSNPVMTNNMNAFFGKVRADRLRSEILNKIPQNRENLIITSLKESLAEIGGKYSIEYFFKDEKGKKTSHFLIFVSKHPLGYKVMKDIMAGESSNIEEGVASFGFNPKDKFQPNLFEGTFSLIDKLAEELLNTFAGQNLSAKEIFHMDNIGKNYIFRNYQDALRKLEEQGKIITNPSVDERRKISGIVTFSENVVVTFPEK